MSKHHPNQDFYKIGGSQQSDGADRGNDTQNAKQEFAEMEKRSHPAIKRTAKKK